MTIRSQGTLQPDVGPNDHHAGPAAAPVTLVEYGDFECPWCFRAAPIVAELQRRFGDQLRFVFRNFPLAQIHPHAMHAAEAAESVNAQQGGDSYWRMHHLIFSHQQDAEDALDDAHLSQYATAAGADPQHVLRDLEAGTFRDRVRADFMSGARSGVNGTPTFFINGRRFDGNWMNREEFAAALETIQR